MGLRVPKGMEVNRVKRLIGNRIQLYVPVLVLLLVLVPGPTSSPSEQNTDPSEPNKNPTLSELNVARLCLE